VDVQGKDDDSVLRFIYLNSFFQAGIKSPLDAAILKHEHPLIVEYEKLDEIPFDFNRKRLSVVVRHGDERLLITKGEAESIFAICQTVTIDGSPQPFDESRRTQATETFRKLSAAGFRALGVAVRKVDKQDTYTLAIEGGMTLAGFAAFLDPPKEGILSVLEALRQNGVSVVIMTGDNQYVTRKIAQDVGLKTDRIVTGGEVDTMDDPALAYQAENGAVFARVSPEQKNRVILALKARGHVVGYIGDGINDAPSLHTADVGISVMNGVEVAKEAAKIILLEKDLGVLNDGIIEGRRCFANIMKYIVMGTSSNFGNMFSMAAASLFLTFLPMLPTQILLNNFLYDVSQISIPGDNVDPALQHRPKRWRIGFIRQFMMIIGPISSLYDFLTFAVLLRVFHASTNAPLFHTGWFVESLATQTLVVFVIRTAGNPLKSRPGRPLLIAVSAIVAVAVVLPYTALGKLLQFTQLPLSLLGAIAFLAITYLLLVQVVKSWFYRRHALL
jgi:P-type Mg2+ transporter